MEIQKYNFIITSEPNSVNDFDESKKNAIVFDRFIGVLESY